MDGLVQIQVVTIEQSWFVLGLCKDGGVWYGIPKVVGSTAEITWTPVQEHLGKSN